MTLCVKCEVKNCRKEAELGMLDVWLCDQHHGLFCDGEDLETTKGRLAHCSGTVVLIP